MFRQFSNISRVINHLRPTISNNNILLRNNNIINNIRNITYYTHTHEFINYQDDSKNVELGITSYAKNSLGEILFIEREFEINDIVEVEDEVITLESTKATGVLSTPIEGEIIKYNEDLFNDLDKYNNIEVKTENEYWLVKIQLDDVLDTTELLCLDEYNNYINSLNTD